MIHTEDFGTKTSSKGTRWPLTMCDLTKIITHGIKMIILLKISIIVHMKSWAKQLVYR